MRASNSYRSVAAFVGDATTALTPEPISWTLGLGRTVERAFWPLFGAVLALMVFNAFFALDSTHVRDYDEARYGVAASEMLHSHSALVTTYGGATEFWNLKPPLGYWLQELSYVVFGETPFALRAPAAFSGLLIVAFTVLFARQVAGPGVGLLSGAILATCFGFLGHHAVRSGDLDVPLALVLLPLLYLVPKLETERWSRLAVGLVLGLAFLIKSFAILPFVAAVGIYGMVSRGRDSWRWWPVPMLIAAVIALTWAVARSVAEDSWEFVYRMVAEDLFQRSTSQIDPGGSSLWDYVGALFDRMAPWPVLILLAITFATAAARRRFESKRWLLLWCYALIPVVLFTIARTHHSWYIVPTYPAWAILAGASIVDLARRAGSIEVESVVVTAVVALGLVACEARMLSQLVLGSRMRDEQVFLQYLGNGTVPRGALVSTAFTPSYSERFLLQTVNGFVLSDPESLLDGRLHRGPRADWMLFHTLPNGALQLPPNMRSPTVYVRGAGYALAQIAAGGAR
ncbi:MAG: glycosyltransferase family 39 protein [Proteobacteria bacterium]|nr:glycosyltransferase family 39 protein [Pseudomonadota bacterium]